MHAGACLQAFQRSFTLSVRLFFPSQFFPAPFRASRCARWMRARPAPCVGLWLVSLEGPSIKAETASLRGFYHLGEADSQLGRNDCLVIRVVNLPTNSSVDPIFFLPSITDNMK